MVYTVTYGSLQIHRIAGLPDYGVVHRNYAIPPVADIQQVTYSYRKPLYFLRRAAPLAAGGHIWTSSLRCRPATCFDIGDAKHSGVRESFLTPYIDIKGCQTGNHKLQPCRDATAETKTNVNKKSVNFGLRKQKKSFCSR